MTQSPRPGNIPMRTAAVVALASGLLPALAAADPAAVERLDLTRDGKAACAVVTVGADPARARLSCRSTVPKRSNMAGRVPLAIFHCPIQRWRAANFW